MKNKNIKELKKSLYIGNHFNTDFIDNRLVPLASCNGITYATPNDQTAIDEWVYNGNFDRCHKSYIRFNDYEIEEYKLIINKND